ncbi:MAG: DUF4258 domain-containing protein [Candidatus Thermoplasmatota archaeon]|nr:DUF4258 domain-containing protein [Candidatus Thermoplasmatota archaeon]
MPSRHAEYQMIEKGISVKEMLETLDKGVKRIVGRKVLSLQKKIEVVYKSKPGHYFVITTYRK